MLMNTTFISKTPISLVPHGAEDMHMNHSDDHFLDCALGIKLPQISAPILGQQSQDAEGDWG